MRMMMPEPIALFRCSGRWTVLRTILRAPSGEYSPGPGAYAAEGDGGATRPWIVPPRVFGGLMSYSPGPTGGVRFRRVR
eukprot:9484283-Pyramimonas_sp.AAC.1